MVLEDVQADGFVFRKISDFESDAASFDADCGLGTTAPTTTFMRRARPGWSCTWTERRFAPVFCSAHAA